MGWRRRRQVKKSYKGCIVGRRKGWWEVGKGMLGKGRGRRGGRGEGEKGRKGRGDQERRGGRE